ncbi:MerR family transcriptional regulator [Brevibacterium aurantiacum]|uniref:MerR family transcriptional regulator n=1 Tax=Brevibacterium aurantiacum TaxID=273384 RepID=A0A556C5B5_BREAU|nr:MerR family transcriptional regulator [Brevibacterium aurantiacum]TSI12647.1 MerR family transcriptional regulator [Brevibacterium aurantiacum]
MHIYLADRRYFVKRTGGKLLEEFFAVVGASRGRTFSISVVAEMTGMGVQTLRQYESRGLVAPSRTNGGTRRYNRGDIARLRRVRELVDMGANLASIGIILDLQDENDSLRYELRRTQ